ncbi:MAG TPA: CocE/NonD family hydrolase [Mycobacteriales bacterium]|nr:CocE/NonD family hydrolase [Mycobacteriales bacterium]
MRLSNRHVRICLLAVVGAVAAVLVVPAAAVPVPSGYAYTDAWFTSTDGTQIHAGVFLPKDRKANERHPVLLTSTPYTAPNGGVTSATEDGLNTEGPTIRFPELFKHDRFQAGRWAYIQVDVRGFGGSGGCFEYYLPNEARDVKVAVEWAAKQPWSTGKVGMWGKSYDAAQQVLALGSKPKGLAATVIQAPGLSAYTALWMNGVHYASGRYATTGVYTADDLGPPQNQSTLTSQPYAMATVAGATANPTCRTDALVRMNVDGDRAGEFWRGKEPYQQAKGSTVPTFWSHGFFDANTKPVHLDVWSTLRGPKQAWFGQYTHLRGHENGVGREGFLDESFRFLDRHVRGLREPAKDPAVTVQSGNGDGRWRSEQAWPPADARTWTMPQLDGTYTDEPGNNGTGSSAGRGTWTVTKPLAGPAHLAGEVVLKAAVTGIVPGVHVVAHLYDVGPDGMARLVTRGALATKTAAQEVRFALYPQDWVFEKGHRIGLVLSGADDGWFSPGTTMTDVAVSKASLAMPLLRFTRTKFLAGDASDGMNGAPFKVSDSVLTGREVSAQPPRQQRR